MNTKKRIYVVKSCPCCNQAHRYNLEIEVVPVLGVFSVREDLMFTVLFTCPTKNTDFQAKIHIPQEPDEYVKGIKRWHND